MNSKQQMALKKSNLACGLINGLINLQINNGLACEKDRIYLRNRLLAAVGEASYLATKPLNLPLARLFFSLAEVAISNSAISKAGISNFLDYIGSFFTPLPSVVNCDFHSFLASSSLEATNYLMHISQSSYYVKSSGGSDLVWPAKSSFGEMIISINTSKPEKSIEEITSASFIKTFSYPKCNLCIENIGHSSSVPGGSRLSLRAVDLIVGKKKFFMHFSPYGYFPHHLVLNSYVHKPMLVDRESAFQILSFVELFPHYFLASNSDLPIVGGSILSHKHFQGGEKKFPIQNAATLWNTNANGCRVEVLSWPIPAIRISSSDKMKVCDLFEKVRLSWYGYDNFRLGILSQSSSGERQNALSLFGVKISNGNFELYVLFRNNAVSEVYPLGIFHAHPESWNIKKENIGIIEQIGMAVLPGRLKRELEEMSDCFVNSLNLPEHLSVHEHWYRKAKSTYDSKTGSFHEHLKECVSQTFLSVLQDCSVFKSEGIGDFRDFIFRSVGSYGK